MSDTPAAVGTWILNFVTPIGELTPQAVLNADGSALITLDFGTVDVTDVVYDGDDVTFTVTVQMPMGEFELTVAATVDGDNLSGSFWGSVGTFPLTGVRKVIAERMLQSLQQSAQVTLVTEADGRRFHELRTELAARHEPTLGFKISYNDLLIRICAHALREHPRANSSLEGDAIRLHDVVNVGLAIEAGGDLVVANVKQADRKSLVEIASDLRGVVDRARANSLDLDDITGGTFTISNLGVYGIDAFTPVLNPPESAILGVGALREKAVARDGQVAAELSMTLSLTFDHRIIDGAPAARFLARIRELIEQPYLLL